MKKESEIASREIQSSRWLTNSAAKNNIGKNKTNINMLRMIEFSPKLGSAGGLLRLSGFKLQSAHWTHELFRHYFVFRQRINKA